ncbi:MAG TPA: L-threonylcarbamoyladenylate synthase [Gemmatimonadales bacterium]|nr:L-threonylcarbamoyladenylate synthase [Gemmatimonadales bacterium]
MTGVVPFDSLQSASSSTPRVAAHVRSGGLLAYPTETVYGLGSVARAEPVNALSQLKGREPGKPFLLLVSNREMAESYGLAFSDAADALARAFWPGPITLVLPGGSGRLPDLLRGPEGGIAVRWTSHPLIAALVAHLGEPLTSTSANLPGQPPEPGAAAIVRDFATAVKDGRLLVLDGGVLGNRPPSTVVDCTTPTPRLVRPGALSRAELRAAVGALAP